MAEEAEDKRNEWEWIGLWGCTMCWCEGVGVGGGRWEVGRVELRCWRQVEEYRL